MHIPDCERDSFADCFGEVDSAFFVTGDFAMLQAWVREGGGMVLLVLL